MERRRDHDLRVQSGIHRRRCVRCGDDGDALQHGFDPCIFACPACGTDLYARPPRSYAELEGVVIPARSQSRRGGIRRFVRRVLLRVCRPVLSPVYHVLVRVPADRAVVRVNRREGTLGRSEPGTSQQNMVRSR